MAAQIIQMPKYGPLVAKKLPPVDLFDHAGRERFLREFNENQLVYIRALEELKERHKRRGHLADEDLEEFYRIWDMQTEDFQAYIREACPQDGLKLEHAVNMLKEDEVYLALFTARLMRHEEQQRKLQRKERLRQWRLSQR
jgi:hypothetical protein